MFDKRKDTSEPPIANSGQPSSTQQSPSAARSTAMIGKTIQIKGSVTGNENLVIEGNIDGSVDLPQNDLTIGESGQVTANLVAKVVKVDGQVTGDINGSEKVVISKSGRVRGNIVAPRVTLEDGAKFKGSIDMDPGESISHAAPSKPSLKSTSPPTDAATN